MSPLFYVLWYSGAALVVLLVWRRTTRLRSSYARLAVRLAAVALGFTTVPVFGGGAWIPIGLYYLTSSSARFAAWGTATLVIASVWFLLFFAVLGVRELWFAIHPRAGQGAA